MIRTNLARFLNAKSPEIFPLEDKPIVNEHRVLRKSHDATREKCFHVMYFNVPRDWSERNSRHSLKAAKNSWVSRSTGKSSIFPVLSVSHVTCILEAL